MGAVYPSGKPIIDLSADSDPGVYSSSLSFALMVEEAPVAARVRARQVEALNGDLLSASGNIPAVFLTGFVVRDNVSAPLLYIWMAIAATMIAGVIVASGGSRLWRRRSAWPQLTLRGQLIGHVCFATLFGAVWGFACLAFGPALASDQMMFLSLIVLACNTACVSSLGPYLPAFFGFSAASLGPLACGYYLRTEPTASILAVLVLVYAGVMAVNVRMHNRQVLAAFRLGAINEVLAERVRIANEAALAATRSKWDTLAHLSHELRTPMNAIIGFSEMMREQLFGALGARYQAYSDHIHQSGRQALDLIDAILAVSQAEIGQISLVESEIWPSVLVGECLSLVEPAAATKHLTLDSRLDQALPRVAVDRAKLREALLNLLTNAIKFTPDGGHVQVAATRNRDGLDIAVSDTGTGIAAGDLARCLEPFVRLHNPLTTGAAGAGLGLSLAKRLVEIHGGSLHIASELGHGTIVTIHMPPERCLVD